MEADTKKATLMQRADIWLIGGLLLAALALWLILALCVPRGAEAVVTVGGAEVVRLPLSKDTEYALETDFGTHMIVVRDGQVSVRSAPCPDKICVRHAPVSRRGETIICLPCGVVVTVAARGDVVLTSDGEVTTP